MNSFKKVERITFMCKILKVTTTDSQVVILCGYNHRKGFISLHAGYLKASAS